MQSLFMNSQYFRGFVMGREAWGGMAPPFAKKYEQERKRLVELLRELATAIEKTE